MALQNVEDLYTLSPVQLGMLFHSLSVPGGGLYFEQFSPAYGAGFDPAAFERAWQQAIDRHPLLRTAFLWEDLDEPVQVVYRKVALAVDHQDWRELSAGERSDRLAAYLEADRRRGFALAAPPLLRLGILRLADDAWRVVWSYHHLLLDGWSAGLLMREVGELYEAVRREMPATPRPRRLFKDYVKWLRQQDLAAAESYWRRVLAGFESPTPLAVDAPPAGREVDAAYELRLARLDETVTARLRAFAQRHRLTMSTLLHGAWALLLARYAGCRDVVFGSTVSGRPPQLAGVETMLGCFINTLPVRVAAAPAAALVPWLAELQKNLAELRRYEHTPLVEVLGWSDVPRHRQLFESLLVIEGFTAESEFARSMSGVFQRTNYPFTLTASPERELSLRAGYEPSRFTAVAMQRLLGHLGALLEGMAALAQQGPAAGAAAAGAAAGGATGVPPAGPRLADLPLLTAAEAHQLQREWNDTAAATCIPADRCLHQPFEASAARHPEATALLLPGERWTYGELDRRANQLARQLRALGVGGGALVAVHLERSAAMVVAVLAVLKAGGAYVPLETSWPAERLEWILASQGIAWVVTEQDRLAELPRPPALAHLVLMDDVAATAATAAGGATADGAAASGETSGDAVAARASAAGDGAAGAVWSSRDWRRLSDEGLPPAASPDDLAYVIFTSGSTGRPKGVMVRHRPALNLIDWVNRTFGVGPSDRLLFITALSFDLSVYDVFGILAVGGSVRMASAAELRDPEALARVLCGEGITFWDSAPAALQQLVGHLPPPVESGNGGASSVAARPLRLVFQSGDWIPLSLPRRVWEAFPRARFISLGGATEATVWSNWYPVVDVDPRWASIPYGRPIQNAKYHVLGPDLEPCPIGVAGDLHIGGDCLSSGYAAEPLQTARQYLPEPLGGEPGERLYSTGDRARYGEGGNIEFLGRLDTQVKVRGFRIELGEIEAGLATHPGVRDVVVLCREDVPGDQRLVAYVVPAANGGAPAGQSSSPGESGWPSTAAQPWQGPDSAEPRQGPDPAELRQLLAARLPAYMVPSAFVTLPALPLTANGKLDRRALPPPAAAPGAPASGLGAGDGAVPAPPATATEQAVAAIWKEVLRTEAIGRDDDFFALGGHSLLLVKAQTRVREAFGKELPLAGLLQHRTVADLARALDLAREVGVAAAFPAVTEGELRADAMLPREIQPAPPDSTPGPFAAAPGAILLTGATGFLGAHLLAELLRRTTAVVHCLVRAAEPAAGMEKLRRELARYGLWSEREAERIRPLPGDLGEPGLGLEPDIWNALAGGVDAIYHNGAAVDFLSPYSALRAANVLGTREILRLACERRAKPLHFVSTLGVLDSDAHAAGAAQEDDPLGDCQGLRGGYAQSKWVGECLVGAARDRGLPVAIYRPGTISGHSITGAGNLDDFASRMFKAVVQLEAVPDVGAEIDLAPVDFVAAAVVWLSLRHESANRTFHLRNPRPMPAAALRDWMRSQGYPLRTLPPALWRRELLEVLDRGEDNALAPFHTLFKAAEAAAETAAPAAGAALDRPDPAPRAEPYDCRQTSAALAPGGAGGPVCPPVDAGLLATYFRHLVDTGFLPPPPASAPLGAADSASDADRLVSADPLRL